METDTLVVSRRATEGRDRTGPDGRFSSERPHPGVPLVISSRLVTYVRPNYVAYDGAIVSDGRTESEATDVDVLRGVDQAVLASKEDLPTKVYAVPVLPHAASPAEGSAKEIPFVTPAAVDPWPEASFGQNEPASEPVAPRTREKTPFIHKFNLAVGATLLTVAGVLGFHIPGKMSSGQSHEKSPSISNTETIGPRTPSM